MITMQDGKPGAPGIYVVQTTAEAATEIKMYMVLFFDGKVFRYGLVGNYVFTRQIFAWAGPIVAEPVLEYDL